MPLLKRFCHSTRLILKRGKNLRESSLWGTMSSNLRKIRGVRVKRIEDSCSPGTPDVYIRSIHGSAWAELKHLNAFPKRPTTPVRIPHFTDQQRLWLREEGLLGGNAWLFIQVGREYFLFDWQAAQHVGIEWTRGDWVVFSKHMWVGRCDWVELVRIIT